MAIKYFECETCDTQGKITTKGDEVVVEDIVYCPVCGADIYEDEENFDD